MKTWLLIFIILLFFAFLLGWIGFLILGAFTIALIIKRMKKQNRIILVGPTASGKNFIRSKFAERGFSFDVSYTTREPREGEEFGVDYNFISKNEFEKMIKDNAFYEWVEYNGNYYGTGLWEFKHSDVFIMETDGIKHLKPKHRKKSLVMFVNTPENVRIERMKERGWDDDKIANRIKTDKEKFDNFTDFDLQIQSI